MAEAAMAEAVKAVEKVVVMVVEKAVVLCCVVLCGES